MLVEASRPSFNPIKNQQQPFHGLPRALDEQKQLEISSTSDSLQQKGDLKDTVTAKD